MFVNHFYKFNYDLNNTNDRFDGKAMMFQFMK